MLVLCEFFARIIFSGHLLIQLTHDLSSSLQFAPKERHGTTMFRVTGQIRSPKSFIAAAVSSWARAAHKGRPPLEVATWDAPKDGAEQKVLSKEEQVRPRHRTLGQDGSAMKLAQPMVSAG